MTNRLVPPILKDSIELLVRYFGVEKVRSTLAMVSTEGGDKPSKTVRKTTSFDLTSPRLTIVDEIGSIRESEPEKHRLLDDFYSRLKARKSLPDSQDIRQFAQLAGLKYIDGKSRKDMVATLLRFLLTLPTEQLRVDIQRADSISEWQRQQGFSVLTDKILGKK